MKRFIRRGLLEWLLAGSLACTGTVGGGRGSATGNSTGTGSGNGTGTGSSVGTGAGGAGGPATMTCVPGIPATTQLRRMLNWQYDAVVRDLLGVTSVGTGATAGPPSSMLYADFDGPMVPDAWRLYQDAGAAIARAVLGDSTLRPHFIACDPAASGCLTQTIQSFGRKAFRRPLTGDEVVGSPGTELEFAL